MQNRPRRIGVTGGIGSGKTTVCREFESLGRRVVYADPLARSLMESDPALRAALVKAFGRDAYQPDGTLNRAFLAATIFASTRERRRMNRIVHPVVLSAIDSIIETNLRHVSEPYVLIEAALIYESGYDRILDAVLLVDAPVAVRIERIARRDALSAKEIRRRISSQESAQTIRRKADFVLDNSGAISDIRPCVCFFDRLFRQI